MAVVAVRVDASVEMGSGHARRCFALAAQLGELGARVLFVSRPLDEASRPVMADAPGDVVWLPPGVADAALEAGGPSHQAWARVGWQQDAGEFLVALAGRPVDAVFIDHYAFDARWHDAVRQALGCPVAAMDDLGDRPLQAEVVLDHNWHPDHRAKYAGKLREPSPGHSPLLLAGPRFALLGTAYQKPPRQQFHAQVRSIGIFMGATDVGGITSRVLQACLALPGFEGGVEVVSTRANPQLEALREACSASPRVTLTLDLPDLSAFFARHDLQVGAGGGATWERCCVGAPTVALEIAINQRASLGALARQGVIRLATLPGLDAAPEVPPLAEVLADLVAHPQARRHMAESGLRLVDGRGAERVALALLARTLALRPATMDDASLLHAWRNDPAIRATSHDTGEIALEAHLAWMARVLADPRRRLFVGCIGGRPVGSIRWDRLADGSWEVSLYLDPGLTGLGLGRRLLARAEDWLAGHEGAGVTARATVRPDNTASARLFEQAGYLRHEGAYSKFLPRGGQPAAST